MAELYYTNISDRQARLLFAYAEANLLNITPNMSRYIMSLAKQGRGYATESAGAMTEFAADSFGLSALCGRVARGNDASVRVLEKSGYRFVAQESGAEDDPYGRGILVYRKES